MSAARQFLRVTKYPSSFLRTACARTTCAVATAHPTRAFQCPSKNKIAASYSFSTSSIARHYPSISRKEMSAMDALLRKQDPLTGPLGAIRRSMRTDKVKKWGHVIYRCDYSSDEAWAKFIANLEWNMKDSLEVLQASDLLPSLAVTVKEDREVLDGASVNQVRELFKSWCEGDEAREELSESPFPGSFRWPRYTYCVHVDADAIDSVVNRAPQPPRMDCHGMGYVNFIKLIEEELMPSRLDDEAEEEEIDEDDGDPNFVKVPLHYMCVETYGRLFNDFTFESMARLRRKEDGVSWG